MNCCFTVLGPSSAPYDLDRPELHYNPNDPGISVGSPTLIAYSTIFIFLQLPELRHRLYTGAGGLTRVVKNCGMQIASELALTGQRTTV